MPAYKYAYDDDNAGGSVSINTGFDTQQFGDLELLGTLMQYKDIGQTFWESVGVGGSFLSRAIYSNGKIYFGCCDKNFYCVDAETGKEVWRFGTNGIIHNESPNNYNKGNTICFNSLDSNMYALNMETGDLLWRFKTTSPSHGDPFIHDDGVYVATSDGLVYLVGLDDGKLMHKFNMNADLFNVTPHKGRLYGGWKKDTFFCMNTDGSVIWRFYTKGDVSAWPPSFSNKHIYIGCWDHNVYCLDYEGRLAWKFEAGDTTYGTVLHDGRLYFGSRDFSLYCVDAESGKQIWKFETGGFVINIVIRNNKVYFGSYDNNVYCVDADTGGQIWKSKTNGFVNAINEANGKVFAGSWDCNMYCFDSRTGKQLWKFHSSMSTPSQIAPPETGISKTAEITWTPETEEEKKKYVSEGGSGDYELNMSQYGVMDKNYVGEKKKGYVK